MRWRAWTNWLWGFAAGCVLASYVMLSCSDGNAQSEEVVYALEHAAAEQGVSVGCLYRIAYRESRYQPWATNRSSGAAGLMQYLPSTWRTLSRWAGYEGASPYDPWAAAHVAAFTIAHPWTGGLRHWQWC
jgi:soluble lytic murein transglycosylase-like protein